MTPHGRIDGRGIALTLILVALTALLVQQLNRHIPLSTWMFWRYGLAWLLAVVWAGACVSVGHELLVRLRVTPRLHLDERLLFSLSLGALVFGLAIFALGIVGVLVRPVFVLLPLAALAAGGRSLARFGRQALGHLRHARRTARPMPWWQAPLLMVAAVAFGLLYIQVLSPNSLHYDARWYHMPVAEHFATAGAIRPTPEGWFMGATPQLVSYLYTWCFLHPSWELFDRVELALHLEVVSFLATVFMVPMAVRRLVPRWRGRAAWPAFFLFPGIFLYDSNLSGAADHIGALWVIPAGVCLLHLARSFDPLWSLLLGVYLAALALSKYSFISVLVAGVVMLALVTVHALAQRRRHGQPLAPVFRGLGIVAATGVVLTMPYWLKNWVFYHDPLYPALSDWIRPAGWTLHSDERLRAYKAMATPGRPGLAGWLESLGVVFSFAFKPNDWPYFHGDVPVFGPLFTLSFFCLPFVRATRRHWAVYAGCALSVLVWHRVYHLDRYLQVILPWMVVATLATFALVWRQHWLPRLALGVLVSLQIIWSGDIPFIATHNLLGKESPLQAAADLLQSSFKKRKGPLRILPPWDAIGASLPRGSKVLVHETAIHLGLRSPSVSDSAQAFLDYRELGSPAHLHDWLRQAGVTHMVWENELSLGYYTLGDDLLFFDFAVHQSVEPRRIDNHWVTRLTAQRPSDDGWRDVVAIFPCSGPYAQGLYHLRDLGVHPNGDRPAPAPFAPAPSRPGYEVTKLLTQAGFLVHNGSCQPPLPAELQEAFPHGAWRGKDRLMLRK